MLDKNKTALTHRVTATAVAFLDSIGCKPIETEVPVAPGWVADIAAFWYPTQTEAKRMHLPRLAEKILGEDPVPRFASRVFGPGPFSVLVEVKTTISDFTSDHKWWKGFPAHLCFVAFPAGTAEVPHGWHGIQTTQDGSKVYKIHRARGTLHAQHAGVLLDFIAAVGVRRDHRTRYVATRAWLQAYRADETERRQQYKGARLLSDLASWLQGAGWKPERKLEEILPTWGIKKPPDYGQKAVEYFQALRDCNDKNIQPGGRKRNEATI